MPSKRMMALLGACLILSSNGLWAESSQAAALDDEIKSKKPLAPVVSEKSLSVSYFSGTDSPKKQRLSRDELLRQAALRSQNSLSVPSKPVRLFVDEDEQPLATDLRSRFAHYNRGDA